MTTFIDSQASTLDQASAWVARLRAPDCGPADYQEFALWLASDESHSKAVDEVTALWEDLIVARALPFEPTTTRETRAKWRLPRLSWASWFGLAGGGLAGALATVLLVLPGADDATARYRTAVGERETVDLTDGSRVEINTDSVLVVALGDRQRDLDLVSGEAFFDVAKDPSRPFAVACGPTAATALGTAYSVRCESDRTEVTVAEGVVRVGFKDDLDAPVVRAGQHLVLYHQNGNRSLDDQGADRHLAWRAGELVFEDQPLLDVVAELQRYTETSIRVADPSIAKLKVSGVFNVRDPQLAIKALEETLPVKARAQDGGQILLLPAQG